MIFLWNKGFEKFLRCWKQRLSTIAVEISARVLVMLVSINDSFELQNASHLSIF